MECCHGYLFIRLEYPKSVILVLLSPVIISLGTDILDCNVVGTLVVDLY